MIIYIPRVINTEEDARALEVGTVIFYDTGYEILTGSKLGNSTWHTTDYTDTGWDYLDRDILGWTALVRVDVVDSLAEVVASRSEFHSVDDVRSRLKEQK